MTGAAPFLLKSTTPVTRLDVSIDICFTQGAWTVAAPVMTRPTIRKYFREKRICDHRSGDCGSLAPMATFRRRLSRDATSWRERRPVSER
jgi:hypothetical protein